MTSRAVFETKDHVFKNLNGTAVLVKEFSHEDVNGAPIYSVVFPNGIVLDAYSHELTPVS